MKKLLINKKNVREFFGVCEKKSRLEKSKLL